MVRSLADRTFQLRGRQLRPQLPQVPVEPLRLQHRPEDPADRGVGAQPAQGQVVRDVPPRVRDRVVRPRREQGCLGHVVVAGLVPM